MTDAASNYVDTTAVREVVAPCRCPGTPHEQDTAAVRVRLGYGELATFRAAGWARSGGGFFSEEDATAALIVLGTVRWSLVDPAGRPRPISTVEVERLDEATADWLYHELEPAIARRALPNGSGAPSVSGQQASAGRTPKTRAPQSSTTT